MAYCMKNMQCYYNPKSTYIVGKQIPVSFVQLADDSLMMSSRESELGRFFRGGAQQLKET